MIYKCIIWLTSLLTITITTVAQKGFFIPQQAKIFFNGNNSTIFSNVINRGQLGIGKKAVLNFTGNKWENNSQSLITDESDNGNGTQGEGGIVRFLSTGSSTDQRLQLLTGGYNAAAHTGPAFYNLYITNPYGVSLTEASTKVRNRLHFEDGHIYTSQQILTVGNNNPGIISGYNEKAFVVTGSSGGMLLREQVRRSDGRVIFPIGAADGLYTPAVIGTWGNSPDDFYMRVFNDVVDGPVNGRSLDDRSVNKTWQIGKLQRPDLDVVEITLLHLAAEEGLTFTNNRSRSYISQYINGQWDEDTPQSLPLPSPIFGIQSSLVNWGSNTRTCRGTVSTESYFTKFTKELPGPKIDFRIWPNPAPDIFYISIGQNDNLPAYAIVVWSIIGQKLREERVNGRPVIEMRGLIPGTYIVGVISNIGKVIEAKKLIVTGY
ncbi:MAG TPA: T9SS type A sorting domain-containing protein [Chitinophagaceae bacterium]|nr:T9SS type A sorting domain-containing protein [Chitinophagaceae bacterium]